MNKSKIRLLVVLSLMGLLFAGLVVAQVNTGKIKNLLLSQKEEQKQPKEKEEATPIQEGVLTEKQKEHSKLYKHSGPKLKDLAQRQSGDIEVTEDAGFVMRIPKTGPQLPALQAAVCNADAVVIGILNNKSSQITEEGNFIFTDHEMSVEEVIKNNASAPIQPNETITITRAGGAIQMNGRVYRAKREDFKSTIPGQRYLFFLHFVPSTHSYLAYGNGTFLLRGEYIAPLGDAWAADLPEGGAKTATAFLKETRDFAQSGCESKQSGSQ